MDGIEKMPPHEKMTDEKIQAIEENFEHWTYHMQSMGFDRRYLDKYFTSSGDHIPEIINFRDPANYFFPDSVHENYEKSNNEGPSDALRENVSERMQDTGAQKLRVLSLQTPDGVDPWEWNTGRGKKENKQLPMVSRNTWFNNGKK